MKYPVIAVVGTPNVGKSTLFNALTGLQQRVGNFPGVTIEPMVGSVAYDSNHVTLIDLPGIYSLNPTSEDERLSVDVLSGRHSSIDSPDAILLVMNAGNPKKCLALFSALSILDVPILIAATMIDEVKAKGGTFDDIGLSHELNVKVIPVVGVKGLGLGDLKHALVQIQKHGNGTRQEQTHTPKTRSSLEERMTWATDVMSKYVVQGNKDSRTERIDRVLLNPLWGTVAFLIVMALFFQSIFTWAQPAMNAIEHFIAWLQDVTAQNVPRSLMRSFLTKGVIAGVGSVIVFLPQILILNLLITLLEESGYLARAAFLVDRYMGLFGLQGRSFIPLLGSFSCAIPGIMATRIIPSYRDRLVTIMATPLMTCSARLPVYTLLISAVVPAASLYGFISLQGVVMALLFVAGAVSGLFIALIMKRTMLRGGTVPFLIEFPPYRFPAWRSIGITMVNRSRDFLTTAGTVILAFSLILWVLTELPRAEIPDNASVIEAEHRQLDQSYAADIGRAIQPIFAPLGFDWKITLGVLSSYAARETFVSAMGQIYAADVAQTDTPLRNVLHNTLPLATGLSILAFYVYALQCVSTMAIMKRETGSWKWPALAFAITFVLAYSASWIVYTAFSA